MSETNENVMKQAASLARDIAMRVSSPQDLLAWVADIIQIENELRPTTFVNPVACQEGCAHCCHIMVEALPYEVAVLHREVCGQKDYIERVAYVAHKVKTNPKIRVACPLLIENKCSGYKNRPATCRGENSLDAKQCEKPKGNHFLYKELYMTPRVLSWGGVVAFGLKGLDVHPVDLRLALHEISAMGPDEPLERWLSGEVLFEASRIKLKKKEVESLYQIRQTRKQMSIL